MHNLPSIDEKNPLYCPSVSATAYLDSIRHRLHQGTKKSRNDKLYVSFARVLDKGLLSGDSDDEGDAFPPRSLVRSASPDSSGDDTITANSQYSIPTWERFNVEDDTFNMEDQWVGGMRGVPIPPRRPKRKRSPFSDIDGPSKHARSVQSTQDGSFTISVRHENLVYSVPDSRKKRRRGLQSPPAKPSGPKAQNNSTLLAKIRNVEGISSNVWQKVRLYALQTSFMVPQRAPSHPVVSTL